jgi:hypothetical protein
MERIINSKDELKPVLKDLSDQAHIIGLLDGVVPPALITSLGGLSIQATHAHEQLEKLEQ